MTMQELLKTPSIVFDPIPSYDGSWFFQIASLLKNSKKEGDVNLFHNFYQKTYCEPLEEIFKTKLILEFKVGLVSLPNANRIGRTLKYSKKDFFTCLTSFLNQEIDLVGKNADERQKYLADLINHITNSNEDLNLAYSEALRLKADKLKDVMEKEFNSEFFDAAMQDYAPYKKKMDFATYIGNEYQATSNIQVGMLRLGDFFERTIDYNALFNCFETDIFYLLFAKIILEFNLLSEKKTNKLANNYPYLIAYQKALESIMEEYPDYDKKILYIFPSGKKKYYQASEFITELKDLLKLHPEIKSFILPEISTDNSSQYKDINLMEKINLLTSETIASNWQFLNSKEIKSQETPEILEDGVEFLEPSSTQNDNSNSNKIMFYTNSGYIGTPLHGLNNFQDYYAFIYPSGKVAFEKIFATNIGVTYVIDIDDFIKMSEVKGLNLQDYLKQFPEYGLKRIFYTSDERWQRNLLNAVNGTYNLNDALEFIASLDGDNKNE